MPYRLKRSERVDRGLKRVATEQLKRAQRESEDHDLDKDTKVHQLRKRMKKQRALLRLIKDRLGDKAFRRENQRARSLARRLGGARDTQVMLDIATALAGDDPALAAAGFERLQAHLQSDTDRHKGQADLETDLQRSRNDLLAMQSDVPTWPLNGSGFKVIQAGLRRGYKRGRKALKHVCRHADDEAMHAWRKRVKDYWYHSRLLKNVWPGLMRCQADELKTLSELLGDHNDLSVLETTLMQLPGEVISDDEKDIWKSRIAREKEQLRRQAIRLGRRIYAEPPGHLIDRVEHYWKAWKESY